MIRLIVLLIGFSCLAQTTFIPDDDFEQALIDQGIDSDGVLNQQVLTSDIENITTLFVNNELINDLTGIEDFTSLETLNCSSNVLLNVDFSQNINLINLDISRNFLTSIDISSNVNLETFIIDHNDLSSLDISSNVALKSLSFGNDSPDFGPFNTFSEIDLSNNMNLEFLDCMYVGLQSLDISSLQNLIFINTALNPFTELDVSNNFLLEDLILGLPSNNIFDLISGIESIDISNNPNVNGITASNTNLRFMNLNNGNNDILTLFNAVENEFLECIAVDDATMAQNSTGVYAGWNVQEGVTYSEEACVLGLEESVLYNLVVYPNPVKDIFHLSDMGSKEVTIVDLLGKDVLHISNTLNTTIDISDLPSGMYFVKVRLGETHVVREVIKE